jgi:hypothetical protein
MFPDCFLGGGFDQKVALELGQSVKADLLGRLLVAEVAEANTVLARLRHEPGRVRDGLGLFAPGTFYSVFWKEGIFSHGSPK